MLFPGDSASIGAQDIVQWEIVLLMQYCDRVDQSMKLSTVFVEGMYSNIRRGAIQIYIPLQKYVLQETLVNIIGDTREFFYLRTQYNYYSENKKRRYYRQLDNFNRTSYPDS